MLVNLRLQMPVEIIRLWVKYEGNTIRVQVYADRRLNLAQMAAVFDLDQSSIRVNNEKYPCNRQGFTVKGVDGGNSEADALVLTGSRTAERLTRQAQPVAAIKQTFAASKQAIKAALSTPQPEASNQAAKAAIRTPQQSALRRRRSEQSKPSMPGCGQDELSAPLLPKLRQ